MIGRDLHQALKPLTLFAKSVLQLDELAAQVIAAEQGLASLTQTKATLQREVETLRATRDAAQAEQARGLETVAQAKAELATQRAALATELEQVRAAAQGEQRKLEKETGAWRERATQAKAEHDRVMERLREEQRGLEEKVTQWRAHAQRMLDQVAALRS